MATLRKRKFKRAHHYYIDFHYNGKRYVKSTRTSDRKDAQLMRKEIEVKILKGTLEIAEIYPKRPVDSEGISPEEPVKLREFFDEYLELSEHRKTRKSYLRDRLVFKNFIKVVGNLSLHSVNNQLVEKYLNSRVKHVRKSTINIELRHLKAAFTKAVHWGYLEDNPGKGIKPFNIPQRTPPFFTKETLANLLEQINEEWLRQIVIFCFNTGVRIGELVNVEWKDVDFDLRIIRIRNKKDFTTKSKKERSIPINDEVLTLLTRIRRRGSYVFESSCGGRKSGARISKLFTKYLRDAGFEREFTFHSLRHTFASHLVQKGVSIYIVSKLLGHSNIKTTEVYAHLAPETFHDAVSLLGVQQPTTSTQLSIVHAKQANWDA